MDRPARTSLRWGTLIEFDTPFDLDETGHPTHGRGGPGEPQECSGAEERSTGVPSWAGHPVSFPGHRVRRCDLTPRDGDRYPPRPFPKRVRCSTPRAGKRAIRAADTLEPRNPGASAVAQAASEWTSRSDSITARSCTQRFDRQEIGSVPRSDTAASAAAAIWEALSSRQPTHSAANAGSDREFTCDVAGPFRQKLSRRIRCRLDHVQAS